MDWIKNKILRRKNRDLISNNLLEIQSHQVELENEFLMRLTYGDIDFFHLNGYERWAKVVKTYDGDTVHCIFFLNGKPFKFKIRLAGIDTAEKNSVDPQEVEWALQAIKRLNELIDNKLVYLRCGKWDKYGRLLASLYRSPEDTVSFNQILINEDLAYKYDGGRREDFRKWAPWDSWLDNPWYKKPVGAKPVDNVHDVTIINDSPGDGDYDHQENADQVMKIHLDLKVGGV